MTCQPINPDDFETWMLQLNFFHAADCKTKDPLAQCSCGLHIIKSKIRQHVTDLDAESDRRKWLIDNGERYFGTLWREASDQDIYCAQAAEAMRAPPTTSEGMT